MVATGTGRFSVSVYFLFIEALFMNMGFFMLIPMLSIHYLSLGMTALFVGNLYAVRILSQQGLQLFGGALADRVPYRYVILVGCLIRSVGFALFAIIPAGAWLFAAAFFFGIGGALFGPAGNAALASLVAPEFQPRAFTIRQATSNIGTTVGPVLGAFLVYDHFTAICWIAGALFAVIGVLSVVLLPNQERREKQPSLLRGVKVIASNRAFLQFVLLFMGYYLIYQQMYIAIPDLLTIIHAPNSALGELFSLEAILEIAASYPAIAWMSRHGNKYPAPRLMSIGMYAMAISWIPLVFGVNIVGILAPVLGLSLGSVITVPNRQTYIAQLADQPHLATFFGVASLSMAIGASVGASGGGLLMHIGQHPMGPIASPPALVFFAITVICAYFLGRLPDSQQRLSAQIIE
ncbi:MFS transporter [Sulfoacidibacillus ferrooxidans]|nr:MFS transporter [Sulfoacidibacillus ferrooxidans]